MLATNAVARKHHGHAAEAAVPRQEAVMGHAIPRQQPAVVLRSRFNHLRALLAVAVLAVAGLTVAVVILANDSDDVSSTSAAKSVESTRGPLPAQLPNSGYEPGTRGPLPAQLPNTRYDGDWGLPPDASAKDYSKNGATGDYAHGPLPPDAPAKDYSRNAATGD
jgi:hypothetical protein